MIVQDLVIVVPDRSAFRDVLNHFDATDEFVEIRLDRRRGERRRAQGPPTRRPEEPVTSRPGELPAGERRGRGDRRRLDVTEPLRTAGWVVIPSRQRSAAGR